MLFSFASCAVQQFNGAYLFHTGQGKLMPLADVLSVGFDLYHRYSDDVYRLDFELNPLLDQFLCPYKPYNERNLET